MTRKTIHIISTVVTLLAYSLTGTAAELVHSVDDAYYSITNTNPPQLQVVARGTVTSSGWGFPKLVPYLRQKPPAQGVLEYDFIANAPAPDRLVTKRPMPIGANNMLHDYYPSIQAIKINARTNSKLIKIVPPTVSDSYGSSR